MPGPRSATLVVTESPVSSAVMMIGCFFDEVVQPVASLVNDGQQFVSLRSGNFPAGKQACYRRFHGGQGRAEIVRDGIQQRGLQPLSLSFGLRLAELFYRSRAFDSDRHHAAHGVERVPRESCSRNTKAPDGPHAETYWDEVNTLRRFDGHFIAEECGFHFLFIKMGGAIS